ncbi:hypothetical protein [Cryobacterium sp. TMS1-13-1]|uniref:hypothetical protein n=1 Tax=Cryobacterium sp. TMS1-13-1 TaxID=1259220 RepID=UPI00106D94AC|nr:hypothetical protein [Cryobacterium sp. TMS1-13-1]TFD22596.1 hypothetical protein E3T31_08040 [Cryobacterium sp. TMS1-13-1]
MRKLLFDSLSDINTNTEGMMPTYEFTVTLDRAPVDDDYDRLFDAGLDDTTPGTEDGRGVLMVTRESASLSAALVSVCEDAGRAGFRIVGLQQGDLVSLKTIAQCLRRSYEGLRLIAQGRRGPGGFPAPISGDGWALYSFASACEWFVKNYGIAPAVSDDDRLLAAADHLFRARALVDGSTLARLAILAR